MLCADRIGGDGGDIERNFTFFLPLLPPVQILLTCFIPSTDTIDAAAEGILSFLLHCRQMLVLFAAAVGCLLW